ncbi:MAG: PatB family C-S lyase [Bacteroidales bacterium]|jgi:cystathionine beta-lyase|nr:PatB family C-S lyase [Bacteroidales bacterium]
MQYDFDSIIPREHTNCLKYDWRKQIFGTDNVIPFWVADMDFKVANEILEDIHNAVNHGIFGYTYQYDSAYEAFISWQKKKHDWNISKQNILFFNGVVPSINVIIQEFTEPGDEIIVQPPIYHPFFLSIESNKRTVIWNELQENEGTYYMDFENLKSQIGPRTKMLLLCNPHNPVGRAWKKEELEELHAICKEHNILVVSDEIHSDILFSGTHTPWAKISEDASQNSITLMAPSKTFNIAGLHLSVIITENTAYYKRVQNFINTIHLTMSNTLSLVGFESAYTKGDAWLQELLTYLHTNMAHIHDYLDDTRIHTNTPEATYLAWLDCSELNLSEKELHAKFVEAGVGLSNGSIFGKGGEQYMRLNFACPRKTLEQGLEKIQKIAR